jgi:hypothetical protein
MILVDYSNINMLSVESKKRELVTGATQAPPGQILLVGSSMLSKRGKCPSLSFRWLSLVVTSSRKSNLPRLMLQN